MSIRVRESYAVSRPGSRPGTRHYRSVSVSSGLGTYLAGRIAWCTAKGVVGVFVLLPLLFCWWTLLAEVWVCAELVVFTVTGAGAIASVYRKEASGGDITLLRLKWHLYAVGVKGTGK